jgi:cyclopropane-fatty-acyl-phospholipid synthase
MHSEPLRYRALDAALGLGLLPDALLRAGSWVGLQMRSRSILRGGVEAQERRLQALLARMNSGPVAELPEVANAQHYELPPRFFELILGPRLKYSGCLWPLGAESLAQAEDAMLELTCERAGVRDGMRILDLGCGWGSLSLWIAERYPNATLLAVSNSAPQRAHIEARRDALGLENLEVVTADVNSFAPEGRFDLVISVEMFEHMRNWTELLRRISTWLEPRGRLFVHVFSHRTAPYLFEGTWAAARFFTAGLMPSHELPLLFQRDLQVEHRWAVSGVHYARTLRAWLDRLDENRSELLVVLAQHGRSRTEARRLLAAWRLFLISTEVIWGSGRGGRWLVSHYLFAPRGGSGTNPEVRLT